VLAEHVNAALGRARLLARVRESEERFRSLIQNASDVITLLEVDGTILYQSPSIERTLGYRSEELVGKNAFQYVHPDDLDWVMDAFSKMLAEPESRPVAWYRFRHKDGSWRYMESIGSNRLDDPRVGELVINSRDITERKLWEGKLRDAEEKYRSLIETIPAITYVAKLDGVSTPIYLSPQYEAILGFTLEERLSAPDLWKRILHPDDRERVLAANARSNATGEPFDEEYRLIAKDGREVWMHDASVVLPGAEGRPSFRQGVMYDVTERRQTEEALHASELRLRTVIEQSPLGIHIFAPDGASLLTNNAWDELWYLDAEEAAREGNVFEDEQLREAGLIRYIERSAEEDAAVIAPLLLFDPANTGREGRPRWLRTLIYPVTGEDGRVLETVLLLEDFTERKWAEDALKESEERYRAVVEQSAEAIWLFDPETKKVLEANAAFQKMLGYDAEELRGMTNYDFVAHSREDVDRAVADKLRKGEATRKERKYRTKDGRLLDVEVGGTQIFYRGKEVVCSTARDITERKRIEEEIRETNRRLGELATLRADFTAMVAHELDTPLAVIRGYADVLATGELEPAESERALSQIQAETEVLNALVEDVRVAASEERRDFVVNPRVVPVDELLDAAARFAVTLPGDHPLSLEYPSGGGQWDGVRAGYADPFIFGGTASGPEVWADPYKIGQVLRNLLANAVKYSPEGAPIELRAVPDEVVRRVRIEVVDHGPGIHPDDVERIFEKFGRGRDAEGRQVAGVGLGLYLSRRILQAHGSDMAVDNRTGGGSVFSFDLEMDR
jgi:PAS domain S-box-containing protein